MHTINNKISYDVKLGFGFRNEKIRMMKNKITDRKSTRLNSSHVD